MNHGSTNVVAHNDCVPTSSFLLEEIWAAPCPEPQLLLYEQPMKFLIWQNWGSLALLRERKFCATATKCQKKILFSYIFNFKTTGKRILIKNETKLATVYLLYCQIQHKVLRTSDNDFHISLMHRIQKYEMDSYQTSPFWVMY